RAVLLARGAAHSDPRVIATDRYAIQSSFVAGAPALRRHTSKSRTRARRPWRGPVLFRTFDAWVGGTMDHAQFKAKQTAAVYVADGLDEHALEDFEMHMMGCRECVEDVESWRAIKLNMPARARPVRAPVVLGRNAQAAVGWRMAASLIMGGVLGTAGGWFGHESQAPNLDSTQTTFFNVPAATRSGGDCTALRLAPDTKFAVLRVPGVSRDR